MSKALFSITKWSPPPPPTNKSPAIAAMLSSLLPGLGHFYCGKRGTAIWTLRCFAFAVGLCFHDITFAGIVTVLYVFAVVDSFHTARETIHGRDLIANENPRIAATLNLLLPGAGYSYMGHWKAGLLCIVARQFIGKELAPLFVVVMIAMAIHAYVLCKKRARPNDLDTSMLPRERLQAA